MKISLSVEGLAVAGNIEAGSEVRMAKLLQLVGLASSTGEATRKLAENAVSVDGEKFNGKNLSPVMAGEFAFAAVGEEECARGVGGVGWQQIGCASLHRGPLADRVEERKPC